VEAHQRDGTASNIYASKSGLKKNFDAFALLNTTQPLIKLVKSAQNGPIKKSMIFFIFDC
jgi:hypothetical protein